MHNDADCCRKQSQSFHFPYFFTSIIVSLIIMMAISTWLAFQLSDTYEFHPYSNIDNKESVLGFRANVWSEYIDNFIDLQWKVFPRLWALSEVAWSKTEEKDFTLFIKILQLRKQAFRPFKRTWN